MSNELMAMPTMSIDAVIERRNIMVEFVQKAMRRDTDYGKIPGTDKDTLLKPGAEKLCTLFGLVTRFEDIKTVEDWTGAEHGGEPFFSYWQKCQLLRDGVVVGEGDGSCNSWEKKYRYRSAQRVCPNCGKPTIFKSKNAGEGFYCWTKKDGCGAKFADNAEAIISQQVGQIPNPEIFDQVNTLLKMAQKRALIAASLITVNASEFFTQDMDDMYIDAVVVESTATKSPQPQTIVSTATPQTVDERAAAAKAARAEQPKQEWTEELREAYADGLGAEDKNLPQMKLQAGGVPIPSHQTSGKRVSLISPVQKTKLAELYQTLHGTNETDTIDGLNALFIAEYRRDMKDATYEQGARMTGKLLAELRHRPQEQTATA